MRISNDNTTCMILRLALAGIFTVIVSDIASAQMPLEGMVELTYKGRKIEGSPFSFDGNVVHLLARDGWLWDIDPNDARDFKKLADHFRCYSPSELRSMLLLELGNDYEVSGTSHYVVAHPKDQRDKWAERFEQLYRSFVSYFSLRGFKCAAAPFPLIGIVCRNDRDFQRLSAQNGIGNSHGVLGFYALNTNRITLYDLGGSANAKQWQQNAAVIIHEATHQTAFNSGLHNRYCPPPLWLAEGLATMFEAPGVYNAHDYPQLSDRINRERFARLSSDCRNAA